MTSARSLDDNQKILLLINKISKDDIDILQEWFIKEGDRELSNQNKRTRMSDQKKYDYLLFYCPDEIQDLIKAVTSYELPGTSKKANWGADDMLKSIENSFKQLLISGDLAATSLPSLSEKIYQLADIVNNFNYGDNIARVAARMQAFDGVVGANLEDQVLLKPELDTILDACKEHLIRLEKSLKKTNKEKAPEDFLIIVNQQAKVQELIGILNEDKKLIEIRLAAFKELFEKKETLDLLKKSSDPEALKFVKKVLNILTFGLFAKWLRAHGAKLANNVSTLFAKSEFFTSAPEKNDLTKSSPRSSNPK